MIASTFDSNFDFYCSHHRTLGCRITHMIGVPMIAVSPLVAVINRGAAATLFNYGWGLQLLGHYVFEHNKPVFLEVRSPFTLFSALLFVSGLWYRFFTGKSLSSNLSQKEAPLA